MTLPTGRSWTMAIPRWTSTPIVEGERRAACRDSLLGCDPPPSQRKDGGKTDKKVGVDTYRHGLERDLFVVVNGLLLVGRIGVAKACDVDQVTEVQRQGDGQQPRGGLLEGEGGGEDIDSHGLQRATRGQPGGPAGRTSPLGGAG